MLLVLGVDRSPHLLDQAGFHQLSMGYTGQKTLPSMVRMYYGVDLRDRSLLRPLQLVTSLLLMRGGGLLISTLSFWN